MGESSCFSPYMSMGLVCDGAAGGCSPTIHRQGLTSFLTTPVDSGQALHLYDTNLHLKGVSQRIPSSWTKEAGSTVISHLAACHRLTFAAVGTSIIVFRRLVPFCAWKKHTNPIKILTIVGDLLVSIAEDGHLLAWALPSTDRENPSENGQITCELVLPPNFKPSTITHPQTYINKVLLGGCDGQCLLVNLRSKRIVHTFSSFSSRITVLEPSPVIDVVGVGLEDGRILLHNFRVDETIIQFQHGEANITGNAEEAPEEAKSAAFVKTLSFRSDGTEVLMSGDGSGNMYTWDLNEKTLVSETRKIHPGGIVFAEFLPGEPLLITTGMTDNAVKIHIFDNPLGQPRILRKRVGHSLPPTIVRFCGYDGFMMISAGLDRELRLVSTVHEARNREFGQGLSTRKGSKARKRRRTEAKTEIGEQMVETWRKLPQVTDIASGNLRQRDGDFSNIVTIHAGRKEAFTWRVQSGALHQHVLSAPDHPQRYRLAFRRNAVETPAKKQSHQNVKKSLEVSATCVAVTPCGNYAIIGQSDGLIHSYNLQSGIHQGAYDGSSTDQNQCDVNKWPTAHDCSVVAIAMGSCGDLLASAGAADKKIKFWNTHGRRANGQEIISPSNVSIMRWCTTSDLLAVSCEDFSVRIYDASTRKLARLFTAHLAPIVDISFDTEGRRIFSASIDNTIKTWYLPTGQNTDTMICDQAPTSIAIAPGGGFLATTHVNDRSIKLWVDESKYGPLSIRKGEVEEEASTDNDSEDEDESSSVSNEEKATINPSLNEGSSATEAFPEPVSTGLRTLSNKPSSQWTVLSNLREIKERNKPIEPPKKPENAPFFLPTLKGLSMQFDTSKVADDSDEPNTKVTTSNTTDDDDELLGNSEFGKLIKSGENEKAAALLQSLDPSGVDLEIRTLEGEKTRLLTARFFADMLRNPRNFELTQAYLTVFLSSQGMELSAQEEGTEILKELVECQNSAWEDLRNMFDSVLALSGHFSGQV